MDRRRLFGLCGVLALALLAGCSAAGSLDMEVATDTRIAEEASRPLPAIEDDPVENGQVVRAAIENGSATARSQEPLVDSELPFSADGRYYNVSSSVVDRQPGTFYRLGIDYNGTARDNATVGYENLTSRDKRVIDQVLSPVPVTKDSGPDYYFDATYTDSERDRSVLLADDTDAVRYGGETYPVTITEREPTTVLTRTYTATVVANGSGTYAQQLRSAYVFELSGLSDAERSVVSEAINDTYYAESDSDDAFRGVLERFQRHEAVHRNEYRGMWLVRYDGDTYVAKLSYEGFNID